MRKLFLRVACLLILGLSARANAAVFNVTNLAELDSALSTASSNGEGDTINMSAGTYTLLGTIYYSYSEDFPITIQGSGSGSTIIDGNESRILNIQVGVDNTNSHITLRGITFQNAMQTEWNSTG